MTAFEKVWKIAKWTCYSITMLTIMSCGFDAMLQYFQWRDENRA